jgi:hypothetical protein
MGHEVERRDDWTYAGPMVTLDMGIEVIIPGEKVNVTSTDPIRCPITLSTSGPSKARIVNSISANI